MRREQLDEAGSGQAERCVDSKHIFSGRVFNVRVDTVTLPGGRRATREVVEHNGAVAMIPIDAEGNVVLVSQYRHPVGSTLLEIPAGRLESGEDPADCAARELAEEIGERPAHLEPLGAMYVAPGYSSELIHYFLATDFSPAAAAPDDDEIIECVRLPLTEAREMCRRGEIRDGKTVCGILLTAERLGV
jgi:ADP-ribose pyrophosphatase